jgi:hypothetical protein
MKLALSSPVIGMGDTFGKDVGDFRREAGGKFEGVGFRVRPPKDDPDALLNLRFTGGRDVWLPDSYGFEFKDLAPLLAGWHSRAIKE